MDVGSTNIHSLKAIYRRCVYKVYVEIRGSCSVVGIATAYGLDDPGIESQWRRDYPHLSGPALRPTHPPVKRVSGLSRRYGAAGA